MPDLILHIGLSKCGSSTLQRHVFQHEEGYLGTAPYFPEPDNFAKKLQQCGPFAGRQMSSRRMLEKWATDLTRFRDERWPNMDRLILSNEMLSGASYLKDRPILDVLSFLKTSLWKSGQIKVLMIIRSQSARIASRYAQSSSRVLTAGQADFERNVRKTLSSRRHRRLLNYADWIDALEKEVGKENLCILMIEESNHIEFWQVLSEFCRLRNFEPQRMIDPRQEKVNARGRSSRVWEIRDFNHELRAKDEVQRWSNSLWPEKFLPTWRSLSKAKLAKALSSFYGRRSIRHLRNTARDQEIVLTDELMEMVRSYFGPSNRLLAAKLGRSTMPAGY